MADKLAADLALRREQATTKDLQEQLKEAQQLMTQKLSRKDQENQESFPNRLLKWGP